jgi:hypothetical protein
VTGSDIGNARDTHVPVVTVEMYEGRSTEQKQALVERITDAMVEAADGIGSIEVGKRADTIVRDLDDPEWTPFHRPIQTLVYSANAHNVAHSIVDGELVMEDREVLTIDEAAVKEQARRVTRTGCRRPGAAAPGGGSPASRCTPRRRRRR